MWWIRIASMLALLGLARPARACPVDFPPQLLLDRGASAFGAPPLGEALEFQPLLGPPRGLPVIRQPSLEAAEGPENPVALRQVREAPDAVEALARAASLPRELALYTAGAVAYHHGAMDQARGLWLELLALPPAQRRQRTTWAQFMLGKLDLEADPARAVEAFQRTRALAASGFADTYGLAEDSLGWEARAEWNRGHAAQAIALYREQWALGDRGGLISLQMLALELLARPRAELAQAARDPQLRELVTAYLVTRSRFTLGAAWGERNPGAERWLEAVEGVQARELEGADRLAWLAYRYGAFDAARRWLAVSPAASPLTAWVGAKLALVAGDVPGAAAALARAVELLPDEEVWQYPYEYPSALGYQQDAMLPRAKARAELAILKLSQQDFVQALDLLVRAGYWLDAAYVAERVLTLEELKAYVDASWPNRAPPEEERAAGSDGWRGDETWPSRPFYRLGNPAWVTVLPEGGKHPRLRALLGRRLVREGRAAEAGPYLPAALADAHRELLAGAATWADAARPAEERALARWHQARLLRWQGMELAGTEVAPDWTELDGQYNLAEYAPDAARELREAAWPGSKGKLDATPAEQARVAQSAPQPDVRFHYRRVAVAYAVEAARLLPRDSEAAAKMLCHATSWLIDRHPKEARSIYREYLARGKRWPWGTTFGRSCPALP